MCFPSNKSLTSSSTSSPTSAKMNSRWSALLGKKETCKNNNNKISTIKRKRKFNNRGVVSFDNTVTVIINTNRNNNVNNNNNNNSSDDATTTAATWYQRADLKRFQLEVRNLVLTKIYKQQIKEQSSDNKKDSDDEIDLRGLERHTLERSQAKKNCIRSVVLAYRLGIRDDITLSKISKQSTMFNKEVAFRQGCHDYCDVYCPHSKSLLPPLPAPTVTTALPTSEEDKKMNNNNNKNNKRTFSEFDNNDSNNDDDASDEQNQQRQRRVRKRCLKSLS